MINLRKHRSTKPNRNSLMVVGTSSADALIQIVLNSGCFRSKDIGSLNAKDTLMVYNFLCSLLAFSEKQIGSVRPTSIVVLVDATHVPIKALRLVLKACQTALAFKMKQAVIIEPDKFFDQQKLTLDILLENYDFKTTLCSKNKIWKYVNVADLAEPFATLPTINWIDLKKFFEDHFSQNPSYIVRRDSIGCKVPALSRFIQKDKSILIELDASSGRYSRLFEENDPIGQRILKNEPIYETVKPKRLETLDKFTSSNEILEKNVEETKIDVPTHFEPSKSLLEIVDGQKTAINELLEWINGPGTKWLQTLNDVGESIDETRQLLKQHQQLSTKTEQIVDQTAEIAEVIEFLLREKNHSEICESLKKLANELSSAVHDFRKKVKQQTMIRSNSLRLHEILNEFYTESDILLKSLCNETKPIDKSETCQEELAFLESKIAVVEERFEVATEICKSFENVLGFQVDERKKDQNFISEQINLATERRKRCHELLDLHKLKLQQMIQLQMCEKDQQQVICWLSELNSSLLHENFKKGLSSTGINAKVYNFEKSGNSFREYGKQLSQVSLLIRRSLRLEISPQLAISEHINSIWREFERNLNRYKNL